MTPDSQQIQPGTRALGVVLAGGLGTRMGREKALITLGGRPLVDHPLRALGLAGLEAVVVAKPSIALSDLGHRLVEEPEEPHHPICGIIAALDYAKGRPIVVVACDMPFVPPALLSMLAETGGRAVVASAGGYLQPLLGRYEASLKIVLTAALEDERSMSETLHSITPRIIEEARISEFGDPRRIFFNVNRPADLGIAEKMLVRNRS